MTFVYIINQKFITLYIYIYTIFYLSLQINIIMIMIHNKKIFSKNKNIYYFLISTKHVMKLDLNFKITHNYVI